MLIRLKLCWVLLQHQVALTFIKIVRLQLKGDGLGARESEFDSQRRQDLFLPHVVQIGSGAHPVSYTIDTEVKRQGAWS